LRQLNAAVSIGLMSASVTRAERLLLLIGSLGPLGHVPASGTVTVALIGVPLFWIMSAWPAVVYAAVALAFTAASVGLHQAGDRILGEEDSRLLVWDELAGYMFAVAFIPFTWQLAVISLLLERTIDILKVPPSGYIEREWPGGWGVVGDDVVAGLYTRGIMHFVILWTPAAAGLAD